jgi:hypothetical protein
MSFPGVPIVRVGYMAANLPYPVNLTLPPVGGTDTRTNPRTTGSKLDLVVPQEPIRHEKLGRFLEAWGALESTLAFVLKALLHIELGEATLTLSKLGMKNSLELLEGLGLRKLTPDDAKTLTTLLDRVDKLNRKRNILVHGHWVLEANVMARCGEAYLAVQFLREVTPIDPEDANRMANPRNQKERVRYTFTLKRIDAATRDTDTLNNEISSFVPKMMSKPVPFDEIGTALLRKSPYRVTYSLHR